MGTRSAALEAPGFVRIDDVVRRMRADLVRANMIWLLDAASRELPGTAAEAAVMRTDRDSRLLREVAIYLGCTQLGWTHRDAAAAIGIDRSRATRAVHVVEERRDLDRDFELTLERIEARIRARAGGGLLS